MKLLNKISLYYLLFAIPVMVACSFISYNMIFNEVIDNTDERLTKDFEQVKEFLKCDTIISHLSLNREITVIETGEKPVSTTPAFSDTIMYDNYEEEMLPFRVLKANFSTPHHDYLVIVGKVYLESEDLVDGIVTSVVIMFVLLIAGFFVINIFVAKRVMKPFNKTLSSLDNYDLSKASEIKFEDSSTKEFKKLNDALNKMTDKIFKDYQNQKQFAENASHEMQTPLAVIKNKIELLIQSKSISEVDMEMIQSIYNSANKLSQLNKTLLLLAKIENRQFAEVKEVNFEQLFEKTLNNYLDIIQQKQISLTKHYNSDVSVKMNPILADVLIGNIIQNAIRHNINGGTIEINLTPKSLTVSNTGNDLKVNADEMFQRFRKSEQSADSVGLGMALIKQVCDINKFSISYRFENKLHIITINF